MANSNNNNRENAPGISTKYLKIKKINKAVKKREHFSIGLK